MFKIYRAIVAVACIGLVFSACTKKEDQDVAPADTTNIYRGTKYIITATPTASTGVADYLLSVDDPTTGTISTAGNGVEQDGTYRYYTVHKGKFFSLLYGQVTLEQWLPIDSTNKESWKKFLTLFQKLFRCLQMLEMIFLQ